MPHRREKQSGDNASPVAVGQGRGREASSPGDLPARGWFDILVRTKNELSADNLSVVAAGVAFFSFLAFVPAIGAVVSAYAFFADPSEVNRHLAAFDGVLPQQILPLLHEQVERLVASSDAAGISLIVNLAIALYSSSKATRAMINGLNIAYDEEERRGFVRLQSLALVLTLGAVVGVLLGIGLLAVQPVLISAIRLPRAVEWFAEWFRWPVLLGGFVIALAVVYRLGPCREKGQWKWVSWGATTAAGLWIAGSALFSWYVATWGSYDKTYGSLGALIVFLMWLYLSAFVVLIGAEINSEMERQTRKDTTTGKPKPLGQRDAYSADTLGPSSG